MSQDREGQGSLCPGILRPRQARSQYATHLNSQACMGGRHRDIKPLAQLTQPVNEAVGI